MPVEKSFLGQGRSRVLYGADVVLDVVFVALAFEFHFGKCVRGVKRVTVDGVIGNDVFGEEFCFDVLQSADLHDPDELAFFKARLPKRVEHLGRIEAESRPVGELVDVEHVGVRLVRHSREVLSCLVILKLRQDSFGILFSENDFAGIVVNIFLFF